MREVVEAGHVSLVEIERGTKELLATLHNDLIDQAKHRSVQVAWLVKPTSMENWECYGVRNCPAYLVWSDVYLYSLEQTELGSILRVIA